MKNVNLKNNSFSPAPLYLNESALFYRLGPCHLKLSFLEWILFQLG